MNCLRVVIIYSQLRMGSQKGFIEFTITCGSHNAISLKISPQRKPSGFGRDYGRSRRPIRLQVPAEFAVANDPLLLQIDGGRIVAITHRRQVPPRRMAMTKIVPVL
jgi:hypothetical protein